LKKIPALEGEVRWGTKVQIGYYAQQLEDLDDRNEIIMELRRVAPSDATAGELRSFLAKFLFTGDDVYKHVRDLSGGEKGRLALAKLIYSRVNVLVLDEPTNHLDIPSREALEEALDAYEGTIVTISHDRYFLNRIATQILALDGKGGAEHYDGDYTEYHDWKAGRAESSRSANQSEAFSDAEPGKQIDQFVPDAMNEAPARSAVSKADRKKKTPPSGKPGVKVIKKKKAEVRTQAMIETEVAAVEQRVNEISQEMAEPEVARDVPRLIKLSQEYEQASLHLRRLYEEWERLSTEATTA